MASEAQILALRHAAAEVRRMVVAMMGAGKAHHFGGSLSSADIVSALYLYKMRYDAGNPHWPERDRFVMSKGHCVPVQYALLAKLGVIPMEELSSLKCLGSRLQGHPAMHLTPGIEACTGALGEGLSYANGLALAGRVQGLDYRVYCLLGDGELHEGQVWEAAMTAAKQRLQSVVAMVDRNGLKGMDATDSAKQLDPLVQRWSDFGWAAREIDGHDMRQICDALDWAGSEEGRPSVIVARTVKGCGVSFMEGQPGFHNAAISEEQFLQATCELDEGGTEAGR